MSNKEKEFEEFIKTNYTDPTELFKLLYKGLHNVCTEQGWGDFSSYSRGKEIYMANVLGHTIASTYSGADAIDNNGNEIEYKSTVSQKINATYNGISVMPTWESQVEYIKNEKIGKYKYHYYARFEGNDIKEIWKLDGDTVVDLVLEKTEKKYSTIHTKKDPRLGVIISSKEILKYGEKVDLNDK